MRELPADVMRCFLCDGILVKSYTKLRVDSGESGGHIVISMEFEGVPARRCDGCGQEYFEKEQVEANQEATALVRRLAKNAATSFTIKPKASTN